MTNEAETTKRTAARFPCCLLRLVRRAGPNVCWVMMMVFILTANSRAAGVDALLVAVFAWGYGFLSANDKITHGMKGAKNERA